jgi:hypothetical protein
MKPKCVTIAVALALLATACGSSAASPRGDTDNATTVASVATVVEESTTRNTAPQVLLEATAPAVATPATVPPVNDRFGDLPGALMQTSGVLVAFTAGEATPVWTVPNAIASPDGTTAFTVDTTARLVRIDARSGAYTGKWPLPVGSNWRVTTVAQNGSHVVLTNGAIDSEHLPGTTRIGIWNVHSPKELRVIESQGALEPEALSTDSQRLFVLDHHSSYYRVLSLDLTTRELFDTFGRDKSPAEDMHGVVVNASRSPDGRLLATLYATPTGSDHEPFVHIIDLEHGWTYCADLPAGRYTSIATSLDGRTAYVGDVDGGWIAIDMTTHPPSTPPMPMSSRGSIAAELAIVVANNDGLSWTRDGQPLARVTPATGRLVALIPTQRLP